ncbi:hypothetical protein FRB94_007004 [Tulasnella sp. JGI-2019a]|nr:hypothetical protein FRB94_007004 [Tulasnella sp. JGI-2019a]
MITTHAKSDCFYNERAGRNVGGDSKGDDLAMIAARPAAYRQQAAGFRQGPALIACSPTTPALIRAARALAAATGKQDATKIQNGTTLNTSTSTTTASKAQQMQARALAAQAAHQKRLAAEEAAAAAAAAAATASASPAEKQQRSCLADTSSNNGSFQFGVGFQGFGGVPFGGSKSSSQRFSAEIPEQYLDMMDELQVDLALPLASPRDNMGGFTSPSAPVDISAFLPPPGPPALVATEATIAASAVPLADWAAELCWTHVTDGGSQLSSPGRGGRLGAPIMTPALASFRAFVNTTLSATLPSPQCLFLGLYYLTLLPIGGRNNTASSFHPNMSPVLGSWTPMDQFRQALYGSAGEGGADDGKVARMVFALALMLGNKWLEDNTFTTRTWHEVTNLPQREIKHVETAALNIFGFSLNVRESTWARWLHSLRGYTSSLVAREPIGMLGSPNGRTLAKLDALIRVAGNLADMDAGMMTERRRSVHMEDDGDDMVVFPRRRASTHSRTTSLPVVPAEFGVDMQLDSPLLMKSRNTASNYAPVQRPPPPHAMQPQQQQPRAYHAHHSYDEMSHHQIQDSSYWTVVDPRQQFERPYYVLHQPQAGHCYENPQCYTQHEEAMRMRVQMAGDYPDRRQAREAYPLYSWQEVEAEIIAAREREREIPAMRGWPRPSEMDWSTNMWSSTSTRAHVSTPV